ncbi:MAG: glycosyltransferase [Gluconacetobacter diazotrophicus]|nr:glycosyltransferase [Gluconacetobacter diazotrophicus]
MKLLLVTPYLPWPLDAGGKYAQFTMIDHLRRSHAMTLLCQTNGSDMDAAEELRARWPDVRLRLVPPAPTSRPQRATATLFDRAWRLKERIGQKFPRGLRLFQKAAYALGWSGPGSPVGALTEISPADPAMTAAIREEMGQTKYDLMQLDFVQCLNLIRTVPASIPRLFVHHQIHFVFHERLLGRKPAASSRLRRRLHELKKQELALLRQFDAVTTLSEVDARLLRSELALTPVYCSPFGIKDPVRPAGQGHDAFDGTILYVGSEHHHPNMDAVNWFLDEVWDEVAAADPHLRFCLVGQWEKRTQERFARHPRVTCLGYVPDLESLLRTSILVVPLRIGSGVRTKILQAMMEGAPVVSTTVGSEGIPVQDGREIILRDDPKGFAQAVLMLAGDGVLRNHFASRARHLVAERYSLQAAGKIREWVCRQVVADWLTLHSHDHTRSPKDTARLKMETDGHFSTVHPGTATRREP